ncbi:Rrf2 family transcriptional regulator [Thalassobaculum sp.]|uniref:Rrf2 family transcriptional regulator n=1 Tax=Thalassobaculum sp. TaxID=2022740 RepID=UPI0032EE572B
MQLSQFTDYALRTLILTALNADRRTTIDEVATAYGISKDHVRKVVHQLTRLGFLQATRGRGGGIRLGMPADRIRVGDVVRGTETTFAMAECLRPGSCGPDAGPGGSGCPIDGACRLTGMLRGAAEAFLAELDRHSLADVTANRAALLERLAPAA